MTGDGETAPGGEGTAPAAEGRAPDGGARAREGAPDADRRAEEGRLDARAPAPERVPVLARRLEAAYPGTELSLDYSNPLELLVATILSAQCTDERVNIVTRELFGRCRTAEDYAEMDREGLEEIIRSTGFYRNKARHIQGMARRLLEEHGGRVPRTMEELTGLPGVARKTANVVLSNAFERHVGVVVDTHVKRVARRLGLTSETNPEKVERDLMELLPEEEWHPFAWRLILHGRNVCSARSPDCEACFLSDLCPGAFGFE